MSDWMARVANGVEQGWLTDTVLARTAVPLAEAVPGSPVRIMAGRPGVLARVGGDGTAYVFRLPDLVDSEAYEPGEVF
jgi:hypothetical protein